MNMYYSTIPDHLILYYYYYYYYYNNNNYKLFIKDSCVLVS
uniref:Uncharacterized protein n=1 Tax=Anguilla anguilla TaxID=7936 RepID=A0A0E9WAW9_ANGAN